MVPRENPGSPAPALVIIPTALRSLSGSRTSELMKLLFSEIVTRSVGSASRLARKE